jgi:hypothetical protein
MGPTDVINPALSSEVSFPVRISSRTFKSSSSSEAHRFCNFENSSRLEVLRAQKFFTFGSVLIHRRHIWSSKYFISLQSFLPLIFQTIRKFYFFFFCLLSFSRLCLITKRWRNVDLDLTPSTPHH